MAGALEVLVIIEEENKSLKEENVRLIYPLKRNIKEEGSIPLH